MARDSLAASLVSPPGLRDAFCEGGWTVLTRKSQNRQQCSRRRGFCDKRGTVLGSLWDDDNDMILVQFADHRTRKGIVLPENMMQWIPQSGKIFRGAGGTPSLREVGGTDPQDRLGSLPSEASSLERCQDHKGWKSSLLGRGQGLRQEQDGADQKPPSRAQRVGA